MSLRSTLRPVAVLLAGLMSLAGVVIATTVPAGAANLPTSLSTTTVATGAAATSTTSAPVNVVGTTTQSIATYFPSGSLRFNGNITAPDGWTKEYTCNGGTTWDALWYYGCVNGVRTVGDLTSLGINAGNQYWQGSRRSGSNGAARIQLNGAGDGWNAVVSSDTTMARPTSSTATSSTAAPVVPDSRQFSPTPPAPAPVSPSTAAATSGSPAATTPAMASTVSRPQGRPAATRSP